MRVSPRMIALIPARSGSTRVPDKNIKPLDGHPLMAYTIGAAVNSGIFADIIVSTDSESYARIARYYGAEVPFLRPVELAGDLCPDIEWVAYTLKRLGDEGRAYDAFSILRPTSPFRQPETICRAWTAFISESGIDSLRAVEKCRQHPGKMWVVRGDRMSPLLPMGPLHPPWHSRPYQSLPEVYIQNASLEMAWSRVVFEENAISGSRLMPFYTKGFEGVDVNDAYDFHFARELVRTRQAILPPLDQAPYTKEK